MKPVIQIVVVFYFFLESLSFASVNRHDVKRFFRDYLNINSEVLTDERLVERLKEVWSREDFPNPESVHSEAAFLIHFIANESSIDLDQSTMTKMAEVFAIKIKRGRQWIVEKSMTALMSLPIDLDSKILAEIMHTVMANDKKKSIFVVSELLKKASTDQALVVTLNNSKAKAGDSSFWNLIEFSLIEMIDDFATRVHNESRVRTTPARREHSKAVKLFELMRQMDPSIGARIFKKPVAKWEIATGMMISVSPLPEGQESDLRVRLEGEDIERALESARNLSAYSSRYFQFETLKALSERLSHFSRDVQTELAMKVFLNAIVHEKSKAVDLALNVLSTYIYQFSASQLQQSADFVESLRQQDNLTLKERVYERWLNLLSSQITFRMKQAISSSTSLNVDDRGNLIRVCAALLANASNE